MRRAAAVTPAFCGSAAMQSRDRTPRRGREAGRREEAEGGREHRRRLL